MPNKISQEKGGCICMLKAEHISILFDRLFARDKHLSEAKLHRTPAAAHILEGDLVMLVIIWCQSGGQLLGLNASEIGLLQQEPGWGRLLLWAIFQQQGRDMPWLGKGKAAGWQPLLCVSPPPPISLLDRKRMLKYPSSRSLAGLGAAQPTWKSKIPAPKLPLPRVACKRQLSEKKGKGTQKHDSKIANVVSPCCTLPRSAPPFLPGPAPYICLDMLQAPLEQVPLYFQSNHNHYAFKGWEMRGLEARYKYPGYKNRHHCSTCEQRAATEHKLRGSPKSRTRVEPLPQSVAMARPE